MPVLWAAWGYRVCSKESEACDYAIQLGAPALERRAHLAYGGAPLPAGSCAPPACSLPRPRPGRGQRHPPMPNQATYRSVATAKQDFLDAWNANQIAVFHPFNP